MIPSIWHSGKGKITETVNRISSVICVLKYFLNISFQWLSGLIEVWFPCSPRDSKSLFQHHSSKASILRRSACFMVQLSHPYMATGKTIAWTRWTFVSKVMSLLLNMLSRLVITFFPRTKRLNFMATVTICSDFGAPQNKVSHCFHCLPIYLPWSDGTRCHAWS